MLERPKITVLLITVRPDHGYIEKSKWHVIGKVCDFLERQTFKDFELIVVDGLYDERAYGGPDFLSYVRPRKSYWVKHKKVAISAYRNAGLIAARGELVVNLDDCCELPPDYLETFWYAYQNGWCLSARWDGDGRSDGPARQGQVYGFGSYPLEAALDINGYDEAFDGSQGLEDIDFSTRLHRQCVKMFLQSFDGFKIHAQSAWDARAVDIVDPVVRCCNTSWRYTRKLAPRRNTLEQWSKAFAKRLCGTPCPLLARGRCDHHGLPCAYLDKGWPNKRPHLLWGEFVNDSSNWPVFNLREERKKVV